MVDIATINENADLRAANCSCALMPLPNP